MDKNDVIGKEIGNYRLIAEINSGAYGTVYKAEHKHLNKHIVAIKLLHTSMGSAKEREQFAQEAQILAMLEHPHILSLLDFGLSERQPYLIARYAAGGSLRDLLKRQPLLPPEKATSILTQIGQALHYAHQRHVIHRDLKPENILFNAQGDALLADFGIATMLSTASVQHLTTVSGTPSYMAPEQFQGIISKEGDQYALGCIAYELVTGHRPFTAPDFLSLGFKHLSEEPMPPRHYNPQVPAATEAAILKAMAKQRSDRYADIPAFLADLSAPLTQFSVQRLPFQQTSTANTPFMPAAPTPSLSAPPTPAPEMTMQSQAGISPMPGREAFVPPQPAHTLYGRTRSLSMPGREPASELPKEPMAIPVGSAVKQPRALLWPVSPWRSMILAALALLVIVGSLFAYFALSAPSATPNAGHQATVSALSHQATANAMATARSKQMATAQAQATVQVQATAQAKIIATAQAQGKPQLLWTFSTGGPIKSSPTVISGVAYVGSDDDTLYAINTVTAQQKWTFATADPILSLPAVVNGIVYTSSTDAKLYAIDTTTGQQNWSFAARAGISASPVVVNGIVYISSGDGRLYAIDATTGQQKWAFAAGGPFWGSPTVANGMVYVGSIDYKLYAVDATTGQLKWVFRTAKLIPFAPTVANGVVYVGSGDYKLYAIDAATGQQKWAFPTGGEIWSSPAVVNGVVYVGSHDHKLYAIDATTGQQKWAFLTGNKVWSSPTVVNGVVYVGSMDHQLYAINAATGQKKWAFPTGDAIQYSSPIVVNGVVYVGSNDRKLYAIAI